MRVPTPFIQLMCYANRLIDVTARAHVTYNARSISGPRGQEARGFKANCFMCSGEKSADSADSVVALVCRHTNCCIWQHRWHRPIFTVSLCFRLSESDRERTDSAEKSRKSWPTCAAARSVGRSRCYRCRTECSKGGSSTARRCSGNQCIIDTILLCRADRLSGVAFQRLRLSPPSRRELSEWNMRLRCE